MRFSPVSKADFFQGRKYMVMAMTPWTDPCGYALV